MADLPISQRRVKWHEEAWALRLKYGTQWICDVCWKTRCWHVPDDEAAELRRQHLDEEDSECICVCHDITLNYFDPKGYKSPCVYLPESWFEDPANIPDVYFKDLSTSDADSEPDTDDENFIDDS